MKYIKTFEQFVNESYNSLVEVNPALRAKKPKIAYQVWIFDRKTQKNPLGNTPDDYISIKKEEDWNEETKAEIFKKYNQKKYYYELWKNVRGGFRKTSSNEDSE